MYIRLCYVRTPHVQPLFAVPFTRESLSCPMTEKTIHGRPPSYHEGVRLLRGWWLGVHADVANSCRRRTYFYTYTYIDLYTIHTYTYYVLCWLAKGTRLCVSLAKHCPCSVD